jgi:hypothetical protein
MSLGKKLMGVAMLCAGLALGTGTAFAKPTVYLCKNPSATKRSVLQGEMAIAHNTETGAVSVSDGLILAVVGKPIEGKVSSDNAARIVFTWELKNVRNAGGQLANLGFRGTYFKKDGAFMLTMKPLGYDNSIDDRGICKIQ